MRLFYLVHPVNQIFHQRLAAFLLPAMPKEMLFPAVEEMGSLPRKTFSMGEAHEKRYYMEARRLER